MRHLFLLLVMVLSITLHGETVMEWTELPVLPNTQGLAGPFAGVSGDALLVAGGANFPDRRPWESGTKHWYEDIFLLDSPQGSWRIAGKLPRRSGYGVSVTLPQGVLCIGGNDSERHHADVTLLHHKAGKVTVIALAPLPFPLAYAAGALLGDTVYVAGGQEQPTQAARPCFLALKLSGDPADWRWEELPAWPGRARILPLAAAHAGVFYLVGGADLAPRKAGAALERTYLHDAWSFSPAKGWSKIQDLPWPIVAAPTPAPATATGFLILGCDDGSQSSPEKINALRDRHPGFRTDMLAYDARHNQWKPAGQRHTRIVPDPVTQPAQSLWATMVTTVVDWEGLRILPSGEARPGVRSARVQAVRISGDQQP